MLRSCDALSLLGRGDPSWEVDGWSRVRGGLGWVGNLLDPMVLVWKDWMGAGGDGGMVVTMMGWDGMGWDGMG
jgi:hypothetical protein